MKTNLGKLVSEGINAKIVSHSKNGKLFIAGHEAISTSSMYRCVVQNPSDSGVAASIVRVIMIHSASGVVPFELMFNPTTDLPTTTHPTRSTRTSATNTSQSTFDADASTNPMSGGDASTFLPVAGDFPIDLELNGPIIVDPGQAVGLNADVGGALGTSADVHMFIAFVEQS